MRSPRPRSILICGAGSVGERHAANLLRLGQKDLSFFRTRGLPFRSLKGEFPVFKDLKQALAKKPAAAFICNPTHLHVKTALACVQAGCDVLIEKPLGHDKSGVDALRRAAAKAGRRVMVGYTLRFHPCLQRVKMWLEAGRLGMPLWARFQCGEYLPDMHPWEDYRQGYAARRAMGGGPALTFSHELDLAVWFFGPALSVASLTNAGSSLEIDTEHAVDILAKFRSGLTANIHLDFLQRPPARTIEIVGESGRLEFDYHRGRLQLYQNGRAAESVDVSSSFDRNQMFLEEASYFLECLDQDRDPAPGIEEAALSLDIALAALKGFAPRRARAKGRSSAG